VLQNPIFFLNGCLAAPLHIEYYYHQLFKNLFSLGSIGEEDHQTQDAGVETPECGLKIACQYVNIREIQDMKTRCDFN
jgi:hypothetical protein